MDTNKYILLTIDVEDWFQVENFKPYIPFSSWPERELRVERNVHRLLDLFDETEDGGQKTEDRNQNSDFRRQKKNKSNSSKDNNKQLTKNNTHAVKPRATFFILGWLAERIPNLVREIQDRGHEVASHGCNHQLPDQLSAVELKQDLTDSKKLLEDITGAEVVGYRAPSFSINDDILKTLQDCGYRYDSSYNSFSLHGRYGKISLNGISKKGFAHKLSDNFYELPVSNLMINGRVLPWGGGGYFRLTPYRLFRLGVKTILKKDETYVFYMHPWEIDPNQPRVKNASSGYIFRHYVNLGKTQYKLINLIDNFSKCHFITCNQYLDELV